jgi:hypothetical protein
MAFKRSGVRLPLAPPRPNSPSFTALRLVYKNDMNQKLSALAQQIAPPFIWNLYMKARRRRHYSPWHDFGTFGTYADTKPFFSGRFGELYAKWKHVDPVVNPESVRYLNYVCCYLADLCRNVPGDFLYAGVSYGFCAKLIYEFTDACAGKTFHLVDPFDASISLSDKRSAGSYNSSADYVRKQYPADAKVIIHQTTIPPMKPPGRLACVVLRTGDVSSEERALPDFYEALSPGGIMLACTERGVAGVAPMWLPTGNALFFKR